MVRTFFLIDDDADDRELFCEAIEAIDKDIICYAETSVIKALEKLNSGKIITPDVFFVDVNTPIVTGWDFLSTIKSKLEYKNIPVVMYSTSSEIEDANKARDLGALCYFKKANNYKSLKESLELIVNHVKGAALQPSRLITPLLK